MLGHPRRKSDELTTVACNREMMAADSLVAREEGLIVDTATKVKRINGDLVACQGWDDDCVEFERWYEAGCDPESVPELEREEFGALVLTSEGRIFKYFSKCIPSEVNAPYIAMGMGDELAIGAMAAGASPELAVQIACKHNAFTGPPVVVEKLDAKH
jgi:ATP-dependent protease HslVU (ClpYQ) peptidase subunit